MTTFLDNLVSATRDELTKRRAEIPLEQLLDLIHLQRPARDFVSALTAPGIKLIAEIKRASPSRGELNPLLHPVSLARRYENAGAVAISVLTEPRFFKGSLADLSTVSTAVGIPVLRKDFILDAYQIFEARAFGADAILLIAAILADEQLADLSEAAYGLGMGVLFEVHDEVELDRAIRLGLLDSSLLKPASPEPVKISTPVEERRAPGQRVDAVASRSAVAGQRQPDRIALGINNRNLVDFTVDLKTTLRLSSRVPAGVALVSESGVRSRDDVLRLEAAGVSAILVGEALVVSADPQERIRSLLGW